MPPEAIDLASRLLQYSPSLRCSAVSFIIIWLFICSCHIICMRVYSKYLNYDFLPAAWSHGTSVLRWDTSSKCSLTKWSTVASSFQLQTRGKHMLIKSCWLSDSCLQGGLLYFMYVVPAVRSISRAYQQVNSRPCEKANASTVYAACGDIEIVYKGQSTN